MDSLFYTDEELEVYDNYMVMNDVREMELFLEDCNDFMNDVLALSTSLNGDSLENININLDLYLLINTVKELKEYKDNINLDDDNRRYVNKKFDELKKELVILKDKHIQIYNSKVDYINERVRLLTTRLNRDVLSDNVNNLLNKISMMDKCDIHTDGDWKQNDYLDTLDYNKLNELYSNVSEVERLLKIKKNEPLELFSEWNYINKTINSLKYKVKKDNLSLIDVNTNMDLCNTLLERILNLDVKLESMRDELSKEMFARYTDKIVRLRNNIKNIQDVLMEKKNVLNSKSSHYTEIVSEIEQISSEYDMIDRKLLEYNGKLGFEAVGIFNGEIDKLAYRARTIIDRTLEHEKNGVLNKEQVDNIYNKLVLLADKHTKINTIVNFEPEVLKNDEEVNKNKKNKFNKFIRLLDELENKVSNLDDKVIDKDVRKDMSELIKKCDSYVDGFEHLLSYYNKTNRARKYEETKIEVDKLKERYKNICNKYYSKCPLRVKATRSIKNLYKEHPKIGLISGGISALALLFGAHSLIPAIMHGNFVIGSRVSALNGMMKVFNKILGGVIGAKSTIYGGWKLANGVLLNANSATTALLKSLASISVSAVSLISPLFIPELITKIKKLVDKIKKSELKEKLNKGIKNVSDIGSIVKKNVVDTSVKVKQSAVSVKEKIEDNKNKRNLKTYYDELYYEYSNSDGISLDDFCSQYELNEEGKDILYLMDEVNKLKNEQENKLRVILDNNKSNGRNR